MQGHTRKPIENPLPVPELLKRAGEGDADCQYWAGVRYFQADGLPEDPYKAVQLCALAAKQGDARALAFLAYCLFKGIVLPLDLKKAARLYRASAVAGYGPAQFTLGICYLDGRGVKKNIRSALKWLNQAADQGDIDALVRLGDLYHEGKEVVEDDGRACGYYRRAAERGSARGQFMYGSFLMKGVSVAADPIAALDLLDLAAAQGYQPAKDTREHFEEYVRFDPEVEGFTSFPVTRPFPVRRRTVIYVNALGSPCYQALACDLYEFVCEHPQDADMGLRDVAALLAASAEEGLSPLPLFGRSLAELSM